MHEVKPKAELCVYATTHQDNLTRIYAGYRRCYSDIEGRIEIALPEKREEFICKMIKSGHESPLEHASLTFHLTCSRSCSHQLVRHRIASYSQQSQRYVKMDDLPYILPPLDYLTDEEREALHREYREDVAYVEAAYARKIARGAKPEDARGVLPEIAATQVLVTMNFRSLLHFFNERCCGRAQWEIRDIANQMLETCREFYPCVFENAGAKCVKLGHCPEAKPCGKAR